jgi:hypothetical protein
MGESNFMMSQHKRALNQDLSDVNAEFRNKIERVLREDSFIRGTNDDEEI